MKYSGFTFVKNTISNSQKPREPRLWRVIDTFFLLTYAGLAVSNVLLQ